MTTLNDDEIQFILPIEVCSAALTTTGRHYSRTVADKALPVLDHVHGLTAKDSSTRAIKAATETLMRGHHILITMRVCKDGRLKFVRAEDA